MNKKNILILFLLMVSRLAGLAQEAPAENMPDPRSRDKIRAAHAAYITERLALTPAEAEKFWPVYREYGEKRSELRQQLRMTRNQGGDESKLLELDLEIKQRELDLEKDYMQRLQKIVPPEKVLKLRDAETDFRKLVLRRIQHRRRH